jgi:hypothetical protein
MASRKKKGHWSVKSNLPFHWAVYLRSSRFSNREHAVFWIDLYVYHEQFDSLVFGPREFKGPAEGVPGIITVDLGRITVPVLPTLEIDSETDIPAFKGLLMKSISEIALPFLFEFNSLEKILQYYISRNMPSDARFIAAIYLLLGRFEDANLVSKKAIQNASSDENRALIDKRFKQMLSLLN